MIKIKENMVIISSNSRMEARGNIKEPSEVNHCALSAIMTNKTLSNVPRLVDKVLCYCEGYMWNAGPH